MPDQPWDRRRQRRYEYLVSRHFTPLEARELSALPYKTPAMQQMVSERLRRRARFEKTAARKVSRREWSRTSISQKWAENLSRVYSYRGWRVQEGPRGDQHPMPVGSPNPWAMYRAVERVAPPKRHISPWQLRRPTGRTRLERGLVFVQRAERAGGVGADQLRQWILEKGAAIRVARGSRRKQLIIERNRLEARLERLL